MSTGSSEQAIRRDAPESRDHVGKIWVLGRILNAQGWSECLLGVHVTHGDGVRADLGRAGLDSA